MSTLSVEIDDKTQLELSALAAVSHQSVDDLVRKAISELVTHERENREDDERWADYLKNGGVDSARVAGWLSDWAEGKRSPCPG